MTRKILRSRKSLVFLSFVQKSKTASQRRFCPFMVYRFQLLLLCNHTTNAMTTSRKCPNCKSWNTGVDYCTSCNHLLNYQIRLEQEQEQRESDWRNREKDKMDIYLAKFKNSSFWPVKALYYVLYSIWFILFTLVSFFIYMVAAGPG